MPTLNSKRVQLAEAALDVDALGKRERQALASTYEEGVRRHAKSVQVVFTTSRKGRRVLKTSMYLEWPHAMQVDAGDATQDDDEAFEQAERVQSLFEVHNVVAKQHSQKEFVAAGGGAATAPDSAAPAATHFTVHEPRKEARPVQKRALAVPAPRAAQPTRQKVDKNALSARGQPAGGGEDAAMWNVVTGRRKSGRSSPTSSADDVSPRKSPRGSSVASEAECSETEDTEQTTVASPRRSLRLAHSESAASPEEGVVARARQLAATLRARLRYALVEIRKYHIPHDLALGFIAIFTI